MTQPAAVAPIVGDPKKPRIFSVQSTSGDYVIGGLVPTGTRGPDGKPVMDPESTIAEIYARDDGGVDVYVVSTNPTFSAQNIGIILGVPAIHVVRTWAAARKDLWQAMQQELSDEAVAQLVSAWTGLPSDLVLERLDELREEIEEGENGEGETEPDPSPAPEPAPPPAVAAQPAAPSLPPNGATS